MGFGGGGEHNFMDKTIYGHLGVSEKGDGGKGTGKKNVTTICDRRHDNLQHFTTTCDIS